MSQENEVEAGDQGLKFGSVTVVVTRKDLVTSAQKVKNEDVQLNMLIASTSVNQADRIVFREAGTDGAEDFEKVLFEKPEKRNSKSGEPEPEHSETAPNAPKRMIKTHRCGEGMDEAIEIAVFDEPGAGNACHVYGIGVPNGDGTMIGTIVRFQKGPVAEAGPNGISCESLLAVVKDRLEGFQAGSYACLTNQEALDAVNEALFSLHERTICRAAAGTEGHAG